MTTWMIVLATWMLANVAIVLVLGHLRGAWSLMPAAIRSIDGVRMDLAAAVDPVDGSVRADPQRRLALVPTR